MAPVARALAGAAVLLAALYCGLDPWKKGAMARFPGFETYPIDLPPWFEFPRPRDPEERLRGAELRFLGELQGPESIVFDPEGRGPYTGVADGRILFFDGSTWRDFAYTSPNRCVHLHPPSHCLPRN